MPKPSPKIIFIGTPKFAVPILESLITNNYWPVAIITAPDKPIGRKQIVSPPPVKLLAEKHNISVFQPKAISNIKYQISNILPDLIVVAAYGQILPKEILEIPKYGCLNIHPSLLPKYRGPSPIQYAILNGDEETGVTIMLMDEKIDAGSILGRLNLPRRFNLQKLNHQELEKNLSELGAKLLIETIPKWINGEIKPTVQNESKATYTKILTKEDGKIDWKKPAEEIERRIRAFNPEPGTFTLFENKIIKILKVDVLSIQADKQTGEVFLTDNKELAVTCGENALILEEIQPEGKKIMTAREFLNGYPWIIGNILYSK